MTEPSRSVRAGARAAQSAGSSLFPRLLILFICVLCVVSAAETAAAQTVGSVTRVQKQAQVGPNPAAAGTPVRMHDEIRTGPGARLEITFRDETTLTLGENARVVVDRYVFNPGTSTGAMSLNASRGALRFATGQLGQMRNKDIRVDLPVAALAVRGTEFWAGIVDYQYGVLLLSPTGRVSVGNALGAVMLTEPGQGTDIAPSLKDGAAPGAPYIWPADKVARALAQTSFGVGVLGPFPGVLVPPLLIIPGIVTDDDDDQPASP